MVPLTDLFFWTCLQAIVVLVFVYYELGLKEKNALSIVLCAIFGGIIGLLLGYFMYRDSMLVLASVFAVVDGLIGLAAYYVKR